MRGKSNNLLSICWFWCVTAATAVDLPHVYRLEGLRNPTVLVDQDGEDVLISVEMLPVDSFPTATNERLSRQRAEFYAFEGLRRYYGKPSPIRIAVSQLETVEIEKLPDRYCLSLKVAERNIRFSPVSTHRSLIEGDSRANRWTLAAENDLNGNEVQPDKALLRQEDRKTNRFRATLPDSPVDPSQESADSNDREALVRPVWTSTLRPMFSRSDFAACAKSRFQDLATQIPSVDLPELEFCQIVEELFAECEESVSDGLAKLESNPLILSIERKELSEFLEFNQQEIEEQLLKRIKAFDRNAQLRDQKMRELLKRRRQ